MAYTVLKYSNLRAPLNGSSCLPRAQPFWDRKTENSSDDREFVFQLIMMETPKGTFVYMCGILENSQWNIIQHDELCSMCGCVERNSSWRFTQTSVYHDLNYRDQKSMCEHACICMNSKDTRNGNSWSPELQYKVA